MTTKLDAEEIAAAVLELGQRERDEMRAEILDLLERCSRDQRADEADDWETGFGAAITVIRENF